MTETNKEQLLQKVQDALNSVRPHLNSDGGDVEIVGISDDMVLKLRWTGNCEQCNMSAMTLKAGIEHTIKNHVPEIKSVQAINGVVIS